jgi:hypothetical protein
VRRAITLTTMVVAAALTACGDDAGSVGGVECGATGGLVSAFADVPTVMIGDVTGDGAADAVTVAVAGEGQYRLDVGQVASVALPESEAFLIAAGAADLDGDGRGDLVIGLPWLNRVRVWRGPLHGQLDAGDAALTIEGPPRDGGLAPLYGTAVLIADVDGDGARDVVVSAPAEREEGCLGQLAPRVHRGPFAAGAVVTEADVDLLLDGPTACLGEELACGAGRLEASANGGPVCYRFPITSPTPTGC